MKTSSTQKEYKKQLNRIKNAIKRGEKQGYLFPENILEEFIVKRPTKRTVERLKKVKPAQLYFKKGAIFLDVETGEITPAKQKRKQIRKEAYKKGQKTKEKKYKLVDSEPLKTIKKEPQETKQDSIPSFYETICDNFIDEIRSNLHMTGAKLLYTWAINRRNTIGEEAFGKEIMDNSERGLNLTFEMLYDDRVATQFINDFVSRAYNNDMITEKEFIDFVEANEEDEAIFTEE